MTIRTIITTILITLFALCGCSKKTDSSDASTTVTVATDSSFVPFEFLDTESGELVGFDIDLIKAIAQEADLDIDIQSMAFDGIVAGLQTSRFDMAIAGMTITEERAERIDFSEPYYDAGLIIAVQGDTTSITSIADLAGKKVGTKSGTTSLNYLKEHQPDADIQIYDGITEVYMDLQAGRIDAILYDAPNIRYYVKQGRGTDLKTVGSLLQGEQYGIGFPKGSPLKAKVDAALQTLRDNGTYDQIYAKWFGKAPDA